MVYSIDVKRWQVCERTIGKRGLQMEVAASADVIGLITAVFIASAVECTEAFTIVLAMGISRGWRAAMTGTVVALVVLGVIIAVAGVTLGRYVNAALLQFIVGALLLGFGLQWLRKAVLRSSGLKALHDEDQIFEREVEEARQARHESRFGVDAFGFLVSFKGVLLEGIEVIFIVITFGIGAANRGTDHAMALATVGAVAAAIAVTGAGFVMRRPLAMIPENTMKYLVALLLSSFGVFWSVEGLGYFTPDGSSIEWPGGTWMLLVIALAWFVMSQITVVLLRGLEEAAWNAAAEEQP